MVANLDYSKGRAAVYSHRLVPWHKEGTVTQEALTSTEALVTAGLDFEVVTVEAGFQDGDRFVKVPDKFATVRTDTMAGLDVVGSRYTPFQNKAAFAFLDDLVGLSDEFVDLNESPDRKVTYETAGALNGGRQVFISLAMPGKITLDADGRHDVIDSYIVAVNSHDGSSPFKVIETPVRPVCSNTVNAGLASAKSTWSFRHTSGIAGRVAAARQTLGLHAQYLQAFEEEAEQLIQAEITKVEFDKIVTDLFPEPASDASDRSKTIYSNKVDRLHWLYSEAPTQRSITGTAWGVEQAIVEYLDWYRSVKGEDPDSSRAQATLLGVTTPEKTRVHAYLLDRV